LKSEVQFKRQTMKKQLLILSIVIVLIFISSCNSSPDRKIASEQTAVDTSTIAQPVTEAPAAEAESPEIKPTPVTADSIVKVPRNIKYMSAIKSEGSVVYYCPRRMLESTDNNVSVTITKTALAKALANLERRIDESSSTSAAEIHESTGGIAVAISRKMKVELKYSSDDFQTIYKPENDDQNFDGENEMNWDWIIRPLNVGSAQISIIVSAFDENNQQWVAAQTPPKIFDIKVQVDPRGYFSKLWGFFGNNPEWLLTQLLFPLIAFFYGKRSGKKVA